MRNKKAKKLRKESKGNPPILVEKNTDNFRNIEGYYFVVPQLIETISSWKYMYKKLKKEYKLKNKGSK